MKFILYSEDLEPITVIDTTSYSDPDHFRLPVPTSLGLPETGELRMETISLPKIVEIWAEPFRRKGVEKRLYLTKDVELALRLDSALLEGQGEKVKDAYQRGFSEGFSAARTQMHVDDKPLRACD